MVCHEVFVQTFEMNFNFFVNPLNFTLASSGQNSNLSKPLVYHLIPAKVMACPSASAVPYI